MSQPLEVSDPATGSVDWKGAEKFMRGEQGEAEAGEGNTEAAEVREFKYRGKAVKVDADTYALLEDLKRDARGANGRLGSELARTRERLAKLEGAVVARQEAPRDDEPKPPDPLLATRDIAAWQRQYDEYHAAKMQRFQEKLEVKYADAMTNVRNEVQTTQREKEWAEKFYTEYDHLDHQDLKPIVAQVYTEHRDEIDALANDPEAAYELLADLADRRIVSVRKLGQNADSGETNTNKRPPRFEQSAGPTPHQKTEEAPREFSAGSWVAKQRLLMSGRAPKEK